MLIFALFIEPFIPCLPYLVKVLFLSTILSLEAVRQPLISIYSLSFFYSHSYNLLLIFLRRLVSRGTKCSFLAKKLFHVKKMVK